MEQLSKELVKKIALQRVEMRANAHYLRDQELLIKETVEAGNNHILQLTRESDELIEAISESERQLIIINITIDDRRFELLSMC